MNTLNKYFVYGTLRPDVEAPWSDLVHRNPQFKLKYYKAYLPYSKMFFNKAIGFAVTIYDKELYSEDDRTMGYILETDSPQVTLSVLTRLKSIPKCVIDLKKHAITKKILVMKWFIIIHKKKSL